MSITEVQDVEGDCELGMRKSKLVRPIPFSAGGASLTYSLPTDHRLRPADHDEVEGDDEGR